METNTKTKITRSELIKLLESPTGATFSGLTYFTDEGDSRVVKGAKMVQKRVYLNATLKSVYFNKVNRMLEKHNINFDWQPNKMTGRTSSDVQGSPIVFLDKNPEIKYLSFIAETHTKPHTEYFVGGVQVEKSAIWNSDYIMPAALANPDKKKNAVKNSMFNHCMKLAAELSEAGEHDKAKEAVETANKLANIEDFKNLEFMFRTVKITNIEKIKVFGTEYEVIEG